MKHPQGKPLTGGGIIPLGFWMKKQWGMDKPAMQALHILFQEEDRDSYVQAMLATVNA